MTSRVLRLAAPSDIWPVSSLLISAALLMCGCDSKGKAAPAKGASPSTLEKAPQEEALAIVKLTPEAEQRLGIVTVPVERRPSRRTRTFGGEVMIPAGQSSIATAPVPGTLMPPDKGAIPKPGAQVVAGQPIYKFVPLLAPDRATPNQAEQVQMINARATLIAQQITAAGDVDRGKAEVDVAKIAFERAKKLQSDSVGSVRDVDETRARMQIAERTLAAAEARKKVLDQLAMEAAEGRTPAPIEMTAPQAGLLRRLIAVSGQTVSSGEPIFEIVNLDRIWIRVPIYVGLSSTLDLAADAEVRPLTSNKRATPRRAVPIEAPPTADPLASTADLYFELENADARLRPGERVGVTVFEQGDAESLVVPEKAVIYDIYGGTWVYVRDGEHRYRRRRIVVRTTTDDPSAGRLAVLIDGPSVGTPVVTDGAAELFGTEFGTGK